MTLLWCDGFDHYGSDTSFMIEGPYDNLDPVFTLSGTNPRTGNRCIRRDSTSAIGNILKSLGSEKIGVGSGISFYMDSMPDNLTSYRIASFLDANQEAQVSFFVEPDGSINCRIGDELSSIVSSSPGLVTSGSYHHIEIGLIADNEQLSTVIGGGNINDLSYTENNLSASTTRLVDVKVSPDGLNLYIANNGIGSSIVYQYTMSTAYDISTATDSGKSLNAGGQVGADLIHSIMFGQSGSKLYITEAQNPPLTTHQYNLSTAFDLSTAVYAGKTFGNANDLVGYAVDFNSSGTKMFALGDETNKVYEYTLSTPWDITTETLSQSYDFSSVLTDAHNIRISSDGGEMYLLGVDGNTIFQFNFSTEYDVSTLSYSGLFFSAEDQGVETHGFDISVDGGVAYVADLASNTTYEYIFLNVNTISDGIIEVRLNSETIVSTSNAKNIYTANREYSYMAIHFGGMSAHGVTTDIDDWYIWDTEGAWNNGFIGDRRCFFIRPNQDTNIADFEPSSGNFGYKMIDDESPDDDSTYIIAESYLQTGSPLTGTSEFEVENIKAGSSLISGINVVSRASKTDNTSAEIYTSINSGADSLSSPAHVLTTSYQYFSDIYEYDPSNISSFTSDGFNSISVSVTADDLSTDQPIESPDLIGSPIDFISPTDITSPISGGDPFFANVVSLLHFEGSDGSTTFTDEIGKTWTAGGNASIDVDIFKYGSASGIFDGSGDYITTATSTDFDFGTDDFTIEMFAYRSGAGTGDRFLIDRGNGSSFLLRWNAANNLQFFINSTLKLQEPFGFTVATWFHLAISRNSGTIRMFINGILEQTSASTENISSSSAVTVGGFTSSDFFAGNVDELRITKGVGRYTANFTPPTEQFPDF